MRLCFARCLIPVLTSSVLLAACADFRLPDPDDQHGWQAAQGPSYVGSGPPGWAGPSTPAPFGWGGFGPPSSGSGNGPWGGWGSSGGGHRNLTYHCDDGPMDVRFSHNGRKATVSTPNGQYQLRATGNGNYHAENGGRDVNLSTNGGRAALNVQGGRDFDDCRLRH